MDTFMNLAKQGYQAYSEAQSQPQSRSQSDFRRTGGEEYNTPHHRRADNDRPEFDDDEVVRHATRHGESDDSSLFSSALNHVRGRRDEHEEPVDEESVRRDHDRAYNQGSASDLSASSMGSAAALQALKSFTSGGGGGGSSQSQLISLAMGEASKLFDRSGGASSGSKQDAVNGAAMTVMKLLVQSKFSGTTGGGDSGGLGSLMSVHCGMISAKVTPYRTRAYKHNNNE
ncbi:beta-flanking protein [Pisolithus marmoratus]|nr:beta-flanking protein [Pisolithus marmoratus]